LGVMGTGKVAHLSREQKSEGGAIVLVGKKLGINISVKTLWILGERKKEKIAKRNFVTIKKESECRTKRINARGGEKRGAREKKKKCRKVLREKKRNNCC